MSNKKKMEESDLNREYKRNAFKVPEGYFDAFDVRVMERLQVNARKLKVQRMVKVWSIAASLFIVSGLAAYFYIQQRIVGYDISEMNFSQEELQDFQNNVEINDEDLINLISTNAVDSIYRIEVLNDSRSSSTVAEIEMIEEEYTPLEDEIEI